MLSKGIIQITAKLAMNENFYIFAFSLSHSLLIHALFGIKLLSLFVIKLFSKALFKIQS